jgi:hypothetical protein
MSELTLSKKTLVTPPTAAALYDGTVRGGRLRVDRYRFLSLDLAEPNLGIPVTPYGSEPELNFITNSFGLSVLLYVQRPVSDTTTFYLSSDFKGTRGWTNLVGDAFFNSLERPDLKTTDAALEELLYKFPEILSFTLCSFSSPVFLEANSVFSPAVLSWTYNKVNLASISATYIKAKILNEYFSEGQYKFRSIPLSAFGTFTTTPIISTVTDPSDPSLTRQQPLLIAEMSSTSPTTLTGIRVAIPGIFFTYDINIVYNPPPIVPPVIEYLEMERFVAPSLSSLDIGDLQISTQVGSTSTFSITALDWAGNKAIRSLVIQSTSLIYYGRSKNDYLSISETDIKNGSLNSGRGDARRIEAFTSRSYNADCSPDGSPPTGYYYFVAYPSYIHPGTPPRVFANGFETTPQVANLNITNVNGVTIPYTVLISNNRQTGSLIPLVIT